MRSFDFPCLLTQLPSDVQARLMPHVQPVTLELDQVLYLHGQPLSWVYFPATARVEEGLPMSGHALQPLRSVDALGMAGSCALADPVASRTARVTRAGHAYRMPYDDFARWLEREPALRELVMQDAARACVANSDGA